MRTIKQNLVTVIVLLLALQVSGCSSTLAGEQTLQPTETLVPSLTPTMIPTVVTRTPYPSPTPEPKIAELLLNPADLPASQYLILSLGYDNGTEVYDYSIGLSQVGSSIIHKWIKLNLTSIYQWFSLKGSLLIIGSSMEGESSYLVNTLSGEVSEFNALSSCFGADLSPDGFKLAANCRGDDLGSNEVFLIDLKTGMKMQLTNCYPDACIDPRWSPDGNMLAYIRQLQGSGYLIPPQGIYLAKIDCDTTSSCVSRTTGPFNYGDLISWSPNGKYLAATGWENAIEGPKKLYVYEVTDDMELNIERIYNVEANYNLAWSPDGKLIAYGDKIVDADILSLETGNIIFKTDLPIAWGGLLGWLTMP